MVLGKGGRGGGGLLARYEKWGEGGGGGGGGEGGGTTVPSGKVGRGGALYERVYNPPPPSVSAHALVSSR